jgi:hypothetical protein
MKSVITPEKAAFIREHYLKLSGKRIAKTLDVSPCTVQRFMRKNNLRISAELCIFFKNEGRKKPLKEEEVTFIHKHIRNHSLKWIAKALNRSCVTIRKEAHRLGYTELLKEKSLISRYQKGKIPENKGIKMSEETYEKVKHTFFKKGHLPHNTLTDYTEVIRNEKGTSYIYIKIPGARKAIPKHRYLWEQAHGTIPKGYNVIFKNGNTLDCCLENLVCVSNEELMQNNTIHRYPNELKTAIKQISKIKKQLTK